MRMAQAQCYSESSLRLAEGPAQIALQAWEELGFCPCSQQKGTCINSVTIIQHLLAEATGFFFLPLGVRRQGFAPHVATVDIGPFLDRHATFLYQRLHTGIRKARLVQVRPVRSQT